MDRYKQTHREEVHYYRWTTESEVIYERFEEKDYFKLIVDYKEFKLEHDNMTWGSTIYFESLASGMPIAVFRAKVDDKQLRYLQGHYYVCGINTSEIDNFRQWVRNRFECKPDLTEDDPIFEIV